MLRPAFFSGVSGGCNAARVRAIGKKKHFSGTTPLFLCSLSFKPFGMLSDVETHLTEHASLRVFFFFCVYQGDAMLEGYVRLVDPAQMGTRYKVLGITEEQQELPPPGFMSEIDLDVRKE